MHGTDLSLKRLTKTVQGNLNESACQFNVHYRDGGKDESMVVEANDSYGARMAARDLMPRTSTVLFVEAATLKHGKFDIISRYKTKTRGVETFYIELKDPNSGKKGSGHGDSYEAAAREATGKMR